MATLVATVGAPDANSYVDLTDFDAHLEEQGAVSWVVGERERALIRATRRVDVEEFTGSPARPLVDRAGSGPKQALKWPRRGAEAPDGGWYASDRIPDVVRRATMALAHALLLGTWGGADPLADYASVTVDVINVRFRERGKADALPSDVRRILRPVLATPSSAIIRMERG